ncbi:GGDEF domain-containing protein OS=Lysinibacillus sphaericus OX=1421 GN=LS41612_14800 PE=4 SV=1 [Lysinibacillus sphaericus]
MLSIYLDLDRFKQINDTLGHAVGDTILIKQQDVFKHCCEKQRYHLQRLGGDEFIVTLTNVKNVSEAAKLAEQIIAIMEQLMNINGQKFLFQQALA